MPVVPSVNLVQNAVEICVCWSKLRGASNSTANVAVVSCSSMATAGVGSAVLVLVVVVAVLDVAVEVVEQVLT